MTTNGNFVSQFGSGPGNGNGTFNSPQGIAVNSTHIFVVDANNFRIQIFEKDLAPMSSKFGQLGTGNGQFLRPTAIAIDSITSTDNIFVADFSRDNIQIFTPSGGYIGLNRLIQALTVQVQLKHLAVSR